MKDDIFLPFLTKQVFITTKVILAAPHIDENIDNIGYSLLVFDIWYQRNFSSVQPIKVILKFSENVPAGIVRYALTLPNERTSISTDGQGLFDLLYLHFC